MPRKQVEKPISLDEAFRGLGEKLKAQAVRPNLFGYKPHPKQIKFHESTSKIKLYIGGNRSGKTTGGVVEDIYWAMKQHPYRKLPIADSEPCRGRVAGVDFLNGIEKIILPEFARWTPISALRGNSWSTAYDSFHRTLNFENGSFIEFMSYDQDLDKFAGTSRHFVHHDEEPPQSIYIENKARLIDTGGSLWFTMTPVEGMTWIFDDVYEPGISGSDPLISVIEVDMTENPYLQETEISQFVSGLSEDERKARVQGKFVQVGGLIYKKFNPELHVVDPIEDFSFLRSNIVAQSLDHGFNAPTAWLWHSINRDGRIVTFNEHYVSGEVIQTHASRVKDYNRLHELTPEYYVGDPSIRNTDPISGTSIWEEYARYGVPILLGNNSVNSGLVRVARYIEAKGPDDRPMWLVTRNCANTIKEILRYRWKTYSSKKIQAINNPQDIPHKKDDHAMDSLRYFIMSRPDLTSGFSSRKNPSNPPNLLGLPGVANLTSGITPAMLGGIGKDDKKDWVLDEYLGADW